MSQIQVVCNVLAVLSMFVNAYLFYRICRLEVIVGTPSASHNSVSPKLPRYESCMNGICGCDNWCASKDWVAGCRRMYDYISRQLQA